MDFFVLEGSLPCGRQLFHSSCAVQHLNCDNLFPFYLLFISQLVPLLPFILYGGVSNQITIGDRHEARRPEDNVDRRVVDTPS